MVNTFAEAFWSPDYKTGISVIYGKLRQGCEENAQILAMITDHVAVEKNFAAGLQSFPNKHVSTGKQGFGRDEGASLRQAYVSILDEISNRGFVHSRIAEDMDKSIRKPLAKWIQGHDERVSDSQTVILNKISSYLRKEAQVQKLQQNYFAKCRQLEDGLEGRSEEGMSVDLSRLRIFRSGSTANNASSRDPSDSTILKSISALDVFNLGGIEYSPETLGVLLHSMLEEIPRQQYKIPIIGKYDDVSTGENICLWMRKTLPFKNIASAEKFGQSLLTYGFLKSVGLGSRSFMNSPSFHYQWQRKALVFEETDSFDRSDDTTLSPDENSNYSTDSASTANSFLHTTHAHHLQLRKDIEDADTQYRQELIALDDRRCELEQAIHRTLDFAQKCEKERLEIIKKAFRHFKEILSLNNSEYADIYDRLGLFQESIHPEADLQYLVKSYKTSYFIPHTLTYRNFDPSTVIQTFGVNLSDVSFVIPWFLDYIQSNLTKPTALEAEKPSKQVRFEGETELTPLENWTNNDVELADIHRLRKQLNTGTQADESVLDSFNIHTVIQTFKEFLLELPDTVISFTIYDLIKNIYHGKPDEKLEFDEKLESIASAMAQLGRTSIESLHQIVQHFVDLKEVYGLDFSKEGDGHLHDLCVCLSRYIFRPRVINGLNMDDKHATLLLEDIFRNHERLFDSVISKQEEHQKVRRERALSASETSRKAAAEERSRRLGSSPVPLDKDESPTSSGNKLRPLTLSPIPKVRSLPLSKKRIPVNVGLSSPPQSSPPVTPENIQYKMLVSPPGPNKELPQPPVAVDDDA